MSHLWSAALLSPPFATLSYGEPEYLPPDAWHRGQRVLVPLGNSLRVAVLIGRTEPSEETPANTADSDCVCTAEPSFEIKPLLWPLEQMPLLSESYVQTAEHLALRQATSAGNILGSILPQGLRMSRASFVLDGGTGKALAAKDLAALPDTEKRVLAQAWQTGKMRVRVAKTKTAMSCRVLKDPPWPLRPSASKQREAIEFVWERGHVLRTELTARLGSSASTVLKSLEEKGLLGFGPAPEAQEPELKGKSLWEVTLNPEQEQCLQGLLQGLDAPTGEVRLVFGVTGSGKTVVYLSLAQACIERGLSVFLLAPEIALARNLLLAAKRWFQGRIPQPEIIFYHGNQGVAERERTFKRAAQSERPVLVVGTRSALFLPLRNPGVLILDEEHDSSFKQDERMVYNAKEVAWYMANQYGGLLVLGSATPDVKTFYASEQGVTPALNLRRRVSGGTMPAIELVDIRALSATSQLLAPDTVDLLRETMKKGDQAIIMLNRRGYAPLMYCLDCGQTLRCPNCDIGLTFHKGRERLVCHYCGQSIPFPITCPKCGSCNYLPMGEGTERLEENLQQVLLPGVKVLRLDRDSTRRVGRMEEILDAFSRKEAQLLVGTQMLSKGHHFPDVTRVIVADADLGLNVPDYRANERTFQLLVQVAGRAGRGEKPGSVCIQTRDPENPCWEYVRNNDYQGFYENELRLRKRRGYPPFVKLGLIRINYPVDWDKGQETLRELEQCVRNAGKEFGVRILGPAQAPLRMLRGRKRFHCLLKAQDWPSIRKVYATVCSRVRGCGELRISLDLDPMDML